MNRSLTPRSLVSVAFGLTIAASSTPAAAQATPLPESIVVGAWTFRPLIEVRVRGEYRRHPFDAGGEAYALTSVLYEEYGARSPRSSTASPG